ncbi:MAG: hypothetical protein QM271_02940 [Bacillota bacterium]|nr:hypothetical protein [Bacillota bacterium]
MKNSLRKLLSIKCTFVKKGQKKSIEDRLSQPEKSSDKDTWTARLNAIHLWVSSQSSTRKRNKLKRAAQLLVKLLADETLDGKTVAEKMDFDTVIYQARKSKSIGFFQTLSLKKFIRQYKKYGQPIVSQIASVQDVPEKPLKSGSTQKVLEDATELTEDTQAPPKMSNDIKTTLEKELDATSTNADVSTEGLVSDPLQMKENKQEDVKVSVPAANTKKQYEASNEKIGISESFTAEALNAPEEATKHMSSLYAGIIDSSTQSNHIIEPYNRAKKTKDINYDEAFEFNIAEDISSWPREDKAWTLGEWALMLDWHLRYINLTASQRRDQIRAFSHLLRTAAKETGFPVNEKYRNEAGISSQYNYLTSYITGSTGNYKYAVSMEQVVKLFRYQKSEYDLLLSGFKERLGLTENFREEDDAATNISFDIDDFVEEIDDYLELDDREKEIDCQELTPPVSTAMDSELVLVPEEIVEALRLVYPDKRYPTTGFIEDFTLKSKLPHALIEQYTQTLLHPKWMAKIGFRPIEPEMKTMPGKIYHAPGYEALEPVLQQAFYAQPLLGNITPTPEQRTLLFKSAMDILNQVLRHKKPLNVVQRDILVLETVMLLQRWNQQSDEHKDTTFWEYICTQYGLRYDMSRFSTSKTYNEFREAIERSLRRHNRLMAKRGKRYYTTMLTQALAPKEKFFDLLEQIFSFYAKNLKYQYIADDPAFTAFSLAMKRRFDSKVALSDESVYIKSLQSSSAIELLFTRCPYAMADFVEKAVSFIDDLVSGRETNRENYLEELLWDWYAQRSQEIKERDKSERQIHSLEKTVTDIRNIRPVFQLRDNILYLFLPSIRLGEQQEKLPELQIYCDDLLLHSQLLSWFGDYFSITTQKTEVPLETMLKNANNYHIRIVINYGGEVLYDSQKLLYRSAIVFNDRGFEVSGRPEINQVIYLLAPIHAVIDEKIEDAYQCELLNSTGQLYRVLLSPNTELIVNGRNLYPSIVNAGNIHIEKPADPFKSTAYIYQQVKYTIYTKAPVLYIQAEGNLGKKYRVSFNEEIAALVSFPYHPERGWQVDLIADKSPKEVMIIDNETQQIIYSISYVVWPDFNLTFHEYQSFVSNTNGYVRINDSAGEQVYPYASSTDEPKMFIRYYEGELLISVPQLRCLYNGKDILFGEQAPIWYKDIPASARMDARLPAGYRTNFYLGTDCFSSDSMDLGNVCRVHRHSRAVEILQMGVFLGEELIEEIDLIPIVFEPYFKEAPLVVSSRTLSWDAEACFVGGKDTRFVLYMESVDGIEKEYCLGLETQVMEQYFNPPEGVYRYSVKVVSDSFFGEDSYEIYQGRLLIGDPAKLRFASQALEITEAYLMDKIEDHSMDTIKFKARSVVMCSLEYMGNILLNGETLTFPCYKGTLYFRNQGTYIPYSSKDVIREVKAKDVIRKVKIKYQVNPVLVWIINEELIALRSITKDGLLVDKEWKTISHYEPNRYTKNNFLMPDYYGYQILDEGEISIVQSNRSIKTH